MRISAFGSAADCATLAQHGGDRVVLVGAVGAVGLVEQGLHAALGRLVDGKLFLRVDAAVDFEDAALVLRERLAKGGDESAPDRRVVFAENQPNQEHRVTAARHGKRRGFLQGQLGLAIFDHRENVRLGEAHFFGDFPLGFAAAFDQIADDRLNRDWRVVDCHSSISCAVFMLCSNDSNDAQIREIQRGFANRDP